MAICCCCCSRCCLRAWRALNRENGANDAWSRQLQNDRDVADLKEKLRHSEEEIKSLRLEKVSVESELSGTKIELQSLTRSHDELLVEYEELQASKSQNSEAEIQLEMLTNEHIATSAQLNAVCADLAATKSSAQAAMEAKEQEFKQEVEKLKFEMSVIKARGGVTDDDENNDAIGEEVEDMAVLKARIEERDRRIAELEMELLKGEQLRRQMHNRIQELRGNIRVFVRARPFLPGDGQNTDTCLDVLPDGESLSIVDNRSGKPLDFKFDKVFPPSSGQDGVFEEVSEFVQSALDGYNVCLFSYGQVSWSYPLVFCFFVAVVFSSDVDSPLGLFTVFLILDGKRKNSHNARKRQRCYAWYYPPRRRADSVPGQGHAGPALAIHRFRQFP